jgi:dephospho-CoA kinase
VREAQAPGGPVLAAIAARFGSGVLDAAGALDRPALRARVLADPAALADLNRIVHPEVHRRRAALEAGARARGDRILVSDIPLLFETTDATGFDVIVLVDAPPAIRRARLVTQRGLTPAEADAMLAAQGPSEAKRARSTYVIDNDGDRAALEARAHEVWAALVARA